LVKNGEIKRIKRLFYPPPPLEPLSGSKAPGAATLAAIPPAARTLKINKAREIIFGDSFLVIEIYLRICNSQGFSFWHI
jgi:hypothetical protein